MIRMAAPMGDTIEEMRDNIRGTPLHQIGDARLMWVNEGDMVMGQMQETVGILSNSKEPKADV